MLLRNQVKLSYHPLCRSIKATVGQTKWTRSKKKTQIPNRQCDLKKSRQGRVHIIFSWQRRTMFDSKWNALITADSNLGRGGSHLVPTLGQQAKLSKHAHYRGKRQSSRCNTAECRLCNLRWNALIKSIGKNRGKNGQK